MKISSFKNIIIPVDLADKQSIAAVLPIAANFAATFNAKLHFIYIIPDYGMKMIEDYLPKNWVKDQKGKYDMQIKNLVMPYVSDDIKVDFYVGRGGVYDEIINYSNQVDADLIILSAVRPQLKDYMLGPNASKIVRHANVSVLVVRE
jgi:nucleotide-binding universal stress UspA family protein